MTFTIAHREMDTIDIFGLKGPLTFGQPDLMLRCEIEKVISRGKTRLVVDLGDVSEIDSTGADTLLCAGARLRRLGGGLVLMHVSAARMDAVEVGRLEMAFEPFELEQEAVNSFFSNRRVKHFDLLELIKSYRKETRPA